MNRYLYLVFFFTLLQISTYGQIVVKDTISLFGVNIIDKGDVENAKYCTTKIKEDIFRDSPYEVIEYQFANGKFYKAFNVEVAGKSVRYFLEKLVEGKLNLYCLVLDKNIRKYYLTEADSLGVIEIPENKYKLVLSNYFEDCPVALENIRYLNYERYSLIKFFRNYNTCQNIPLFRTRFGLEISGLSTKLFRTQLTKFTYPDFYKPVGLGTGIFVDIPISSTCFSLHPEIMYRQINVVGYYLNVDIPNDVVINYSALTFPLLIRYTYVQPRLSPYIQSGFIYNLALKNEGTLYDYNKVSDNIIQTEITHAHILQNHTGGIYLGGGIIFNYGAHYSGLIELNYNQAYNLSLMHSYMYIGDFSIKIGLEI